MRNLIKKIIKEEIINEFNLKETFTRPLKNISKLDDFTYIGYEDNVKAIYNFRLETVDDNIPKRYFGDLIDYFYEFSWKFDMEMDVELKNDWSWVKATTTSIKIIDDFIRTINPKLIKFSGRSEGTKSMYNNDIFVDKLRSIFGQTHNIILDDDDPENRKIYISKREYNILSEDTIRKNMDCMTYEEAYRIVKFPKKKQFKRILKKEKYLF